jgi:hypothetical protein
MAATIAGLATGVATGVHALKESVATEVDSIKHELDPIELIDHMLKTYFWLRVLLIIVALAFPLALRWFGHARGIPFPNSMSDYYHTANRDIFVGSLAATGAMLIAYRGHGGRENWLLNLAGVFAILVASFPSGHGWQSIHGYSAISFFVCITLVAWFCSSDTLRYLNQVDDAKASQFHWAYRLVGLGMIVSPLWAMSQRGHEVFWVEFGGIYAFAAYWTIKTYELHLVREILRFQVCMIPYARSRDLVTAPVIPVPAAAPARSLPM